MIDNNDCHATDGESNHRCQIKSHHRCKEARLSLPTGLLQASAAVDAEGSGEPVLQKLGRKLGIGLTTAPSQSGKAPAGATQPGCRMWMTRDATSSRVLAP